MAGVPGVLLDLVQGVPAQAPAGAALEPGRVGDGREHVEVGGADRGGELLPRLVQLRDEGLRGVLGAQGVGGEPTLGLQLLRGALGVGARSGGGGDGQRRAARDQQDVAGERAEAHPGGARDQGELLLVEPVQGGGDLLDLLLGEGGEAVTLVGGLGGQERHGVLLGGCGC